METDTHAGAFRKSRLPPTRFFRNQLEDAAHAVVVELWSTALATTARRLRPRRPGRRRRRIAPEAGQEPVPELDRILPRRMGQLVDERLDDEGHAVARRGAQEPGRNA